MTAGGRSDQEAVDVHLLLSPNADPVQGRLLEADGRTTDFEGYMELIAVLERVLGPDRIG